MTTKPLVIVTWLDAHGTGIGALREHELPHEALKIHTLGWLLRDDEKGVSVACEFCEDGAWRGVTFVPKVLVESVVPIKKSRKKPPTSSHTDTSGPKAGD